MYLIEILLPVFDKAGRTFAAGLYSEIQQELTWRFGGVTAFTRNPAHCEARDGGAIVHDDIILVEVMTESIERTWWRDYRRSLERTFSQDEIVERPVLIARL